MSARGEHEAEGRAVEAHQEAKHAARSLAARLKQAARKRDRSEAALREAYQEIDELLLIAREERTLPEAARILGVRREWAHRRVQRYEERRQP